MDSCEVGHTSNGVMSRDEASVVTSIDSVRLAALQLASSSNTPAAVAALARLNVFEALARAGDGAQLTASELAALAMPGTRISVAYLGRLLRLMSGKRILRETVVTCSAADGTAVTERRYSLEPIARFFVDDEANGSFVDFLFMYQDADFWSTWQHLHESVVDDTTNAFARAHGGLSTWDYAKQTPTIADLFNKAMTGLSKVYMRAVLDAYRGFDNVQVVVDVGGGFGSSLGLITARLPHIRGINFDQPHVIDACSPLPRVKHVAGNMFESVPHGGDTIFMKHILHDWDDERCVTILKNCLRALPADGKVVAVDNMLPDEVIDFEGGDHLALQSDIHMLAFNNPGAQERTPRHYRHLGLAAGFRHVHLVCKVDLNAVTEFHK